MALPTTSWGSAGAATVVLPPRPPEDSRQHICLELSRLLGTSSVTPSDATHTSFGCLPVELIGLIASFLPSAEWVEWDRNAEAPRSIISEGGQRITYKTQIPTDEVLYWVSAYASRPFPTVVSPVSTGSGSTIVPTTLKLEKSTSVGSAGGAAGNATSMPAASTAPPALVRSSSTGSALPPVVHFRVRVVDLSHGQSLYKLCVGTTSSLVWPHRDHSIMVGFLPRTRGWFAANGLFMAQCMSGGQKTGVTAVAKGDIIRLSFYPKQKRLEWYANDVLVATAYHVSETELYPAVSIIGDGNSIDLIDSF